MDDHQHRRGGRIVYWLLQRLCPIELKYCRVDVGTTRLIFFCDSVEVGKLRCFYEWPEIDYRGVMFSSATEHDPMSVFITCLEIRDGLRKTGAKRLASGKQFALVHTPQVEPVSNEKAEQKKSPPNESNDDGDWYVYVVLALMRMFTFAT
jgi:hypothetical protein